MIVRWLKDTPFGMAGENVEYPIQATKPWFYELLAGAEIAGDVKVDYETLSAIESNAFEQHLQPWQDDAVTLAYYREVTEVIKARRTYH